MNDLLGGLRRLLRSLAHPPGFAPMVVATLGIGLGAAITLFTLVRGVLLSPLPYPEPERVVRLLGTRLDGGGRDTISYPNFLDWRERSQSFAALAAYDEWEPTLLGADPPEKLTGASVNAAFFSVLGVEPAVGRFFLPGEDSPGVVRAVVLGHRLWQRRFGGDPGVVGRPLTLNGTPYEVVGVAPAGLEDPLLSGSYHGRPEIWRVSPAYFANASRDGFAFTAVGRLRPGVSVARAQHELDAIMVALRRSFPEDNAGHGVRLMPLQQLIVEPVEPALLALLAATGLLLLVACANVASLLLTRSLARGPELAVRAALGAGSGRLMALLGREGLLLALAGGALGLWLATLATPVLLALAGSALPRAERVAIDAPVVAFAAAAALLAALLAGLSPAWRAGTTDPATALRRLALRQTGEGRGWRTRSLLVGAEVALSLILLVAAGLMLRSFAALLGTDPGFRPAGVLTVELTAPYPKYAEGAKVVALGEQLEQRLAALPGVSAVGIADILPMSDSFNGMTFTVTGRPEPAPGEELQAEIRVVSPGFFTAAGLPLLRGRAFAAADGDEPLAVIDRALARRVFQQQDPIGERLELADRQWRIVGIAGEVRQFALARAPEPTLYLARPAAQPLGFAQSDGRLLLRATGDPAALAAAARAAVHEVDPELPIGSVRPLDELVAASTSSTRLQAACLAGFAAMALLLGAVGIYGRVASSVAARRRELGIRSALGADRRRIVRLALGAGMAPVLAGVPLGLAGAWGGARLLGGLLYGVPPLDGWSFGGAGALLLAIAAVACWLPARRAAGVDPVEALRG